MKKTKIIKKLMKAKNAEQFRLGLAVILFVTVVFMYAFISEESRITGFATADQETLSLNLNKIPEFESVESLETLGEGNYFIDNNGLVQWIDDESRPVVGHISDIDELQKNRQVHIDSEGRIGYVLEYVDLG